MEGGKSQVIFTIIAIIIAIKSNSVKENKYNESIQKDINFTIK